MRIIDIEDARANLEQLIDGLKPSEWFAISVDGVPEVKVVALFPEEIEKITESNKQRRRNLGPRAPKAS